LDYITKIDPVTNNNKQTKCHQILVFQKF
jgi:hypothetical protein